MYNSHVPITATDQKVAAEVRAEIARQNRGHSELAAVLGKSHSAVSRRVNGLVPFEVGELVTVAQVLKVPVVQLLGDAGASSG